MAAASSRWPGARQGRLRDLLRRPSHRGPPRCGRSRPTPYIYVLNGLMPGTAPAVADAHLRPVINSPTELAEWDSFVATTGWRGGAALHVDTGMNRLGLTPEEAIAIAPRLQSEHHGFTLLMSHLACADTPDHPLNDRQIRLFRDIRITVPRHPLLARQFLRHLPRRHRPLRPGAAGHRALRRQSDAGQAESDAPGGRAQRPHHPGPQLSTAATPSATARP